MEISFQKVFPKLKLRKQETDTEESFIDTMKLLQLCTALMPPELSDHSKPFSQTKLKAYKNKSKCLSDFESACQDRGEDDLAEDRYQFFVDIAPAAWEEYNHWRHHDGWNGKYLHESKNAIVRSDEANTIADGLIFPVLSAMSLFVTKKRNGRWVLRKPDIFDDAEMITAACDQYKAHKSNPMHTGRDVAVYESLMLIPKMIQRLVARTKSAD